MKDGPNTTSNPVYQNGALASHKALSTTTIQQNELRGSNAPEDAVDAMATVAFADEEDTGFFGMYPSKSSSSLYGNNTQKGHHQTSLSFATFHEL